MATVIPNPPPPSPPAEIPPEAPPKSPWYERPTILALLVTAVFGAGVTFINSRFNSIDSRFNSIDTQLVGIREELSDVAQRTSRIEGQLDAEVVDDSVLDIPEESVAVVE